MTAESVPARLPQHPRPGTIRPGSPAGATPAGHNRITTQALTSTARAVAADVLGVPPAQVRASFSDDGGLLALLLALALPVPPLARVVEDPDVVGTFGGSLWERAEAARTPVLERIEQLTGARLSRVDIRVVGSTVTRGARVL